MKRSPIRKTPKNSLSKAKKRLDNVFSRYIRTKYSKNGYVACFTCNAIKPIAEMQNGHYVSRTYNSLRFSELNCHPQCPGCNVFKHGNMDEYARALVKKYGPDILETLAKEKRKIKQFTVQEFVNLTRKY